MLLIQISTLFPYTTLFRSSADCRIGTGQNQWLAGEAHVCSSERRRRWLRVKRSVGNGAHTRGKRQAARSEEHTSELQSRFDLVCRLLLVNKKLSSYI